MSIPTSLWKVSHRALRDGLCSLREDLERLQEQFRQRFAEAVGTRTGGWVYDTLFAVLSGSENPTFLARKEEPSWLAHPDLKGHEDAVPWADPFSEVVEESCRERASPDLQISATPSLSQQTLLLMLSVEALGWWLKPAAGRWPPLSLPIVALLWDWLVRRLPSLSSVWKGMDFLPRS